MGVELWFAHESRPAGDTFIRFLVTVYKTVCISIISAVKCFTAHLTGEWLGSGVDLLMFLEVLWIYESCRAYVALVRTFARMARLDVIVQQTTPFEAPTARFALVSLVVEVGGPFMGLQVRPLGKTCVADIAHEWSLSGMGTFVVFDFCFSGKSFATCSTDKGFVV